MSKYVKVIITLLFLGSFGFSGGGYFLLFFMVPFEEWLVQLGKTQKEIDEMMKYFVYGWVIFGFLVSYLFYRFIVKKKRKILAYVIAGIAAANASFVFYMFVNTDTALVALSRGEIQESSERFTFGPYPQLEDMKRIKEEGYDGIITLLSPTIVFENKLLTDELANGKEVGLSIHSFPMLPWIGDNQQSINGILELINKDQNGRYYVHCYLGKHRVDYIKRLVMNVTGVEAEERDVILDDDFERGFVFAHESERIIVGPYPTDGEWFDLLRKEVKEIVSLVDPQSNSYQKERKLALENDIVFTPIADLPFDKEDTEKLAAYLQSAQHTIYVHSFTTDERMLKLHLYLKKGLAPIDHTALPPNTTVIGNWMAVGDRRPDVSRLLQAGIHEIQYGKEVPAQPQGTFVKIDSTSIGDLYKAAREIYKKDAPLYVYEDSGLHSNEQLITILNGFEFGYPKKLDDTLTQNGQIEVVNRKEVFGPSLAEGEWEEHIVARGVQKVVMVYAASIHSEELQMQMSLANKYGIPFEKIDMFEGYEKDLLEELTSQDDTTYVIVPDAFKDLIIGQISD
ncbi:protein-tyrosine phosphatase family protein [Priestia abyssalis]|uniref:hypothetical protein n=1 Tax=Priestia abyssalis TaxID=1221450 RepID=UPI00099516B6|nr:hypothetical protein [Priestia abyssalis]